jgi:hypothetical protein
MSAFGEELLSRSVVERVVELGHRHELLRVILEPVCESGNTRFTITQKRVILRLLNEIDELLERLDESLFDCDGV